MIKMRGRQLHLLNSLVRRLSRPLAHGILAGAAVLSISSLGLFYVWHSAREAQLDAVRTELAQLARTAATLVDGDLHRSITSQEQAGSPGHLALLEPLVKFHKAASDIIYVYTAVLQRDRIYYVLGTDYLYRVAGDSEPPDAIMKPHDTYDPTLRRALSLHEAAVNDEPVRERVRSYMSAYAPFFDRSGRFAGVVGIDMWLRDFDARIASIRRAGIGAFAAVAIMSVLAGFVVLRLSRTALRAQRRDRVVQLRLAEAKKLAEARAQSAQAASRAKTELLAVMSHEIRTPISGVLGFANLLLDTPLNSEQREFAETVQRSGDALLTVLNDVLDYSKMEAGRMTVEQIDMSLLSVFDAVRAILQPAALERGVVMNIEYDARLPQTIKGDPARIHQVLLNLAGNAVKFTNHGSVLIAAERLDAARVKISVTDSGIGITEEQAATLFQSYVQADASIARRFGGTGLGLAISKTLVELMGGEIGVLSRPGAGSMFWFELPLQAGTPAVAAAAPVPVAAQERVTAPVQIAAPAEENPPIEVNAPLERATPVAEAGRIAVAAPDESRPRLLLVEDNFVNQRVALYMLAKLGYQVDAAITGVEALARLGKTRYQLILMDCQMPEMDGFETTRRIRDPGSPVLDHEVPIVAMTANAFPEDRARAIASGMNDFLSKPVDQSTLSAAIEKWLGARGRAAASPAQPDDSPSVRAAATAS
jgi:signal transduction histidine kinase/FixJ family two-component response regulator